MNRRKAIRLLKEMKAELDTFSVQQPGMLEGRPLYWLRKIRGYADQFFEKGSEAHIMLSCIDLSLYSNIGSLEKQHADAIEEAKSRINHCVDFIERFGLYHPPRKNMLESWSNGFIILILNAIGAGTFLIGKYTSDLSAMELRRELKDLRDSVHTAATSAPLPVIIHDTIWLELDSSQHMRHGTPSQAP